jgi:hypothetical protein
MGQGCPITGMPRWSACPRSRHTSHCPTGSAPFLASSPPEIPSPATSTWTWRSSAPGSPACGPPTTSRRGSRICGSPCASVRSPVSAHPGVMAAGAPRCSRRPWPSCSGWPAATRRWPCTAPCRARWMRSAEWPRPRGSTAIGPRAGRFSWRVPRRNWSGPPTRSRRHGHSASARRTCGCCPRRRPANGSPPRRFSAAPTPRTARRSTRRGWPAGWPRRSGGTGSRCSSAPRSPRSRPAGSALRGEQ